MVASGVPNENDGRHVFEIADISLEFREVGNYDHFQKTLAVEKYQNI